MIIKEEIEKLILSYKKDFKDSTGITLVAFPDTRMEKIQLERVREATEYIMDTPMLNNRKPEQVKIKKFLCRIADEMGYTDKEIADCLRLDRTSIYHYRNEDKLYGDYQYEREFAKYKSELLKRIENKNVKVI